MTFEDDAHAEAARRLSGRDLISNSLRDAFVSGALWARGQEPTVDFAEYDRGFDDGQAALQAQEPTEAQVEAAARALYAEERNESMGFNEWPEFDSPENVGRPIFEEHARAALLAAKEADR